MPDPNELSIEIKFAGSTKIKGDKGDVETKDGSAIQRFQVDQKLGMPDYFSVQLLMSDFADFTLLDAVKPGVEIEMLVGYGTEETIFKGECSYIAPHFSAGQLFIEVSGYDKSHRLTRGTNSQTFGDGHEVNQNFGTLLGTLIGDSKGGKDDKSDGLAADAGSTDASTAYFAQYNTNLYDTISRVGASFGLDFNSGSHAGGSLAVKSIEKGSPAKEICRDIVSAAGIPAVSADFLCSTVKQVASVLVRGWDTSKKKAIIGKSDSVPLVIGGKEGYKQTGVAHFGAAASGRVVEVVDIPVSNVEEAKEIATGIHSKLSMDWMTATVMIEGEPTLHAGLIVKLNDFGVRFSGEYLIEGCHHVFVAGSGQSYRTYLNLARNGSEEP